MLLAFTMADNSSTGRTVFRDSKEMLAQDLDPLDRCGVVAVVNGADYAVIHGGMIRVRRATEDAAIADLLEKMED